MGARVLLDLVLEEVLLNFEVVVELFVQCLQIGVAVGQFARPTIHFLSIEYNNQLLLQARESIFKLMRSSHRSKNKKSRSKSKSKKKFKESYFTFPERKEPLVADPMKKLILAFSEVQNNNQWMVPLGGASSQKIDGRVIGQTHIINGPAQSGKASLVYWALRKDSGVTAMVVIDCSIYRTEMQFIQKLAKEIGEQLEVQGLDRRAIAQDNIKLSQLNGVIKEQGRPLAIIIRNAERLVEFRKQILLYNLLEWVATDIKKWVGLVFTTRLVSFVDRFEKRVKSRLSAQIITLFRPSPGTLLELFLRRVEWLCEKQRYFKDGRKDHLELFEKIYLALRNNQQLLDIIKRNQEYAQKDIVFSLNVMKMVFSSYESDDQILQMNSRELAEDIASKFEENLEFIFPFIPKNLLQTCTFPEYLVMTIICYMGKHNRTPYRFKTVFEIYQEFKQTWLTSEGMGSAFMYSKNILERSVLKLQEMNLIELDNKEESIWNCDIRCAINSQEINSTFEAMDHLPRLFKEILKS